jgi:GT2 family glycosyltransferase
MLQPPEAMERCVPGFDIKHFPLKSEQSRPWFYFDSQFYIAQCIDRGISPPLGSDDSNLAHYLSSGGRYMLSPNPLFDEEYYRRIYPAVAKEIETGRWSSGFEHFVRAGAIGDLSPIWFFDGSFYKSTHPDLTDENLRFGGFPDRYSHYLLVGITEARAANWIMLALGRIVQESGFPVDRMELSNLLMDGSGLPDIFKPVFDYAWMTEKYSWGRAVRPVNFIRYYLLNVRQQKLSPSPFFDEPYYLSHYPEIDTAVGAGEFSSGYEHFLLHGLNEWRRPFAAFDPRYYADANMAREAPANPPLAPFVHFLRNRKRRLPIAPPLSARDIPEEVGKGLYERRCLLNAPRLGALDFTPPGIVPDVSIIIIARDNYEQTANCIVSAVYNTQATIEVVVFDNASTDETRRLPTINPQIKYLRAAENLGFTIAVNRAAEIATGQMILLLNNDTELTPGAIDTALAVLAEDRSIGAVGAKIVRMHGRLQEGGSIVWRDGSCLGYGRERDPTDGQVNFRQDVDFCSGCFLAVMRAEWEAMGGFDEAYAPAYYEETDFCLRVWERGRRVVYDPRIVIWHYEFGSSSIREEPLALMRRNQRYFAAKHKGFLADCLPPSLAHVERARLRHVTKPRVLFIEDMLPDPTKGMGFVRSAAVARVLEQASGLVSMLGLHNTRWPTALPNDAAGRRVEILTEVNVTNIARFLRERAGLYDVVWLSRTHNLPRLREWRAACPEFFASTRVVLDTEAIAATRRFAYAQQARQKADLAEMVLEELEHLEGIDHICAVNQLDRDLIMDMLERRGLRVPVSVLGQALAMRPDMPAFKETSDIVLVGSYSEPDSPNADALLWFDRAVRPLIGDLPGLRFVIAGSGAARFAAGAGLRHSYHIIDSPPAMADVLRTARLMVAPTRFAAGVPMKVHEAASHGVPVVMTELLATQLGWRRDGIGFARSEPDAMANAVELFACDQKIWQRSQALQAQLVAEDCDGTSFDQTICAVIVDVPVTENMIHVPAAKIKKREKHAI